MRTLFTLAAWLLCSCAWGQIEVPSESEVGDKLTATVNATIPEGAQFDGGWAITCPDPECSAKFEPLAKPNSIGIWAKKAGTYTVTYNGFWLLTKEVTFKDGEGNDVTIISYLGHGFINESSAVKVTGGTPKPDPDPEPDPDPPTPPVTAAWGLILEETGESNPKWAVLKKSLRLEFDKLDYRLLILDETKLPSSLGPLKKASDDSGHDLPTLVLVTDDGQAVRVVKCPDSVAGVKKELGL